MIKRPGEEGKPKLLGLQKGLRVARTVQSTGRREDLLFFRDRTRESRLQ